MENDRPQRLGRLAGGLWVAGALAALAISLSLGVSPNRSLAGVLPAVLIGAICFVLPWHKLGSRWLHLPCAAGSIAVAGALVGGGAAAYGWLIVPVALFAALALPTRGAVIGELAFAIGAIALGGGLSGAGGEAAATIIASSLGAVAVTATVFLQRMQVERSSQRDPLTGVGNYRVLGERLRYEIVRHERHQRSFAVMLLDLDRFKLINDRFGHLEGDRLLRGVGRRLVKLVRDQDTVARQGGDEFSALLPETGDQGAAIVAAKVDSSLAELVIGGSPVRASVGWSVFPQDGRSPEALLAVADERQREAKRSRHQRQPDTRVAAAGSRVAA